MVSWEIWKPEGWGSFSDCLAGTQPTVSLCVPLAASTALHLILRYPLIIDPSGQATEFIMNEYKDRKITRTSFLDDAFRKNLESALRFGNPLLVQVRAHLSSSESQCL